MNKKPGKFIAATVISGVLLYGIYMMFTTEQTMVDSLRLFLPLLCNSCILLGHVFSTKEILPLPEEILENEAYIEAKERQESGGKIFVTGILMMGIPFILLLVLGELNGLLGGICLLSFFVGILAVLMGLFVGLLAGKDLAKIPVEIVQDPQPERIISRAFTALGGLALIAWAVLWLLQTMDMI